MGATLDLSGLHMKSASLHVVLMSLPMLTGTGLDHHGEIMGRVATLVDHGRITPLLDDARFSLEEVGAAHDRLTSGRATGKVVLDID